MLTYKNTLLSVLILSAVLTAAWMTLSYHPSSVVPVNVSTLPDAYMENVTAVIMNKQGALSMKIITPKLTHYLENDTTQFLSPQVTFYRSSQPWYVTSAYAKATQGMEQVDFWKDVVLRHIADQRHPETLIKSPTLTVHPNQQTAETSDLITLIQPNILVRATGMHANIDTGDIQLLSQARGEYVPSS